MTITDLIASERAKIATDRKGHLAQYTACHDRELLLDIVEAADLFLAETGTFDPAIATALAAWRAHHLGDREL